MSHAFRAAGIISLLLAALLLVPVEMSHADNMSIDGARQFQTIDGFGVNANSLSWKNGELIPALDMLADDMGVTLWRVVFDMEDWEQTNDNSDPAVFNWDYYNAIYAAPKFQNLWGTIAHLNQKGISSRIILSLMGRAPTWMGGGDGSRIDVAEEDEWVEMVASLAYYARNTAHVSFSMLDPLNEPDQNGYEGPLVDHFQYSRLLNKLARKLDALGLGEMKFVGPNTANVISGVQNYMSEMMDDPIVMSKVYHFGLHNYAGTTDGADQTIKSSAYPDRNFYMTEITTPSDILNVMDEGTAGICMWDGYDSVYNHAILMGYGSNPPNDAGNGPAPLAYNASSGEYSARKVFHLYKQLFKYVPPGSIRVAATQNSGIDLLAFYHPLSGRLTIVGRNTDGSIAYNGTLANLPAISALQFYWTSETDPSVNFLKGSDVVVTNREFSFTAPPSSMFTLTGLVDGADTTPPTVSITAPQNGAILTNSVTLTASAADNVEVAGVRFLLDGANLNGEIVSPPYTLSWDSGTIPNGSYMLSAVARDLNGNSATSIPVTVVVANQDTTPPSVSVTSPSQNAVVAGAVTLSASASDTNGVAGVQFLLDGVLFGAEIAASPYSLSLDTTTLNDGPHTVAARARDSSGNTATSAAVPFSVLNNPGTVFPITFVQKASNITTSSQNLAATLPSAVTAGNLIVVSVSGWPNLPATTAVTDSLGNSYSIAGTVLVSQGAYSAIYYAPNVAGGATTVTVRTVATGGQISMAVAEFSGVDRVSPLDRVAGGVGSGTAPSSGTMTPSMAGELLVGSGTHNGNTITSAGTGFSMIAIPTEDSNTHQPLAMEYRLVSNTSPASATFSLVNSYPWTQNGALFRPAFQQGPDVTPPESAITAPANGATVSGMVTVSATATDNIGVTRVEFFLDDQLQASDTTAPYGWAWNSTLVPNGPHTLRVTAHDAAANSASSAVTILVDNFIDVTLPTVAITAPANGATVSGSVAVNASASDDVAVARVEFYLDGQLQFTDSTAPYQWSWNSLQAGNGSRTLFARAYDAAGNAGQSASIGVTVSNDTTAPTVSVTAPANNAQVSGTVNVAVDAADNLGVTRVEFYLDGVLQGTDTTVPYGFSWNTGTVANGLHTLAARAYDAAGNIGTSSGVVVTVNNPVAGIAMVQKASNITTSAQNLAATLPSAVTAGNLIVVSVSGWPNLPATTAVTDSLGNSYSIAGTVLVSQGAYSAIYYAPNVAGGAATITVRTVATGGQISMAVAEFSGVDRVSPLDRVAGGVGSGTAPSSGTMTPSMAGELLVGSGTHNGNTITSAGTGFSMIAIPTEDSNTHQPLAMEYRVLSDTSPAAATFSLVNSYPWTQNGALFRPAVQQGPDVTPPESAITAPANGATVSGMVTVSATATDNIGVTRVEFYLDGQLQFSDTTVPYQWSWNSLQAGNGSHSLFARAYDAAGNAGQSASIGVTVSNDTTAPTVSVTAPANNAQVSGTVNVAVDAADNLGVTRVEFYLNGALQETDTTVPYGFIWNTGTVANGLHTLAARAYDSAGNIGTSSGVVVTVNNPVAGIAMVQKASNITTSAQNLAATLPSAVTAGNLIVVSVSGWPNLPAATAVTDSLGNSYSIAGTVLVSQGAYSAIYYAKNVRGGTNRVTVRTTRAGGQISMVVAEFSGVDTVSPLDKTAGSVGSGATPSSGTMTPSMAGDLVIGCGTHNGNTVTTAGPGFTMIAIPTEDSNSHQPLAMEYQVLSGSQQTSASFNLAVGYPWTQNGALFKHK